MGSSSQEDFARAFDDFGDGLFRFCYFRTADRETAKDLVQETFCRVWEYLASGRKIGNLRAFLYRTARNLVIDGARKKRMASLEELEEKGITPADHSERDLERKLLDEELLQVLGRLDEKYRSAVMMRFLDELSVKEIASILGLSENVVSVRIHRGLKQLREFYGK